MKKRILFILVLGIVVGLIFFGNINLFNRQTAYAVGDLTVDWGIGVGDVGPIFNVLNMAPGDMESRDVEVSNGAANTRPVGVRAIKTSGDDLLSAALKIIIFEDGTPVYGEGSATGEKTLSDFFDETIGADFVSLSTLGSGDSTTYTFKVTFDQDSGNEFQNLNVVFDLKIGIEIDVPAECEGIEFDLQDGLPIFGTDGNDRINGTLGNDLIFGLEGDDRIFGHAGDDCLIGNEGNDELRGETGNDLLFGNDGDDLLVGAVGNDLIFGGNGDDNIRGENGNDEVHGGAGNDKLDGGAGNDLIHGNDGDDEISGMSGNDTLFGDEGFDSINGHAGIDTCDGEAEANCEI